MIFSNKKKGNAVLDTLIYIVIIVSFAVTSIALTVVLTNINTDVQADTEMSNETKTVMSNVTVQFPTWFDNAFAFLVIAVWFLVIVLSFLIDSNPVFMVISILLLLVVFILGAIGNNMYDDVATTDADFIGASAQFPKTAFIMDHFLIYTMVVGFTLLIVLYGKGQR